MGVHNVGWVAGGVVCSRGTRESWGLLHSKRMGGDNSRLILGMWSFMHRLM